MLVARVVRGGGWLLLPLLLRVERSRAKRPAAEGGPPVRCFRGANATSSSDPSSSSALLSSSSSSTTKYAGDDSSENSSASSSSSYAEGRRGRLDLEDVALCAAVVGAPEFRGRFAVDVAVDVVPFAVGRGLPLPPLTGRTGFLASTTGTTCEDHAESRQKMVAAATIDRILYFLFC